MTQSGHRISDLCVYARPEIAPSLQTVYSRMVGKRAFATVREAISVAGRLVQISRPQ